MLWIHAPTNAAQVVYFIPIRNRTFGKRVRVSVRVIRGVTAPKNSISAFCYCSLPKPARIGFLHLIPEMLCVFLIAHYATIFASVSLVFHMELRQHRGKLIHYFRILFCTLVLLIPRSLAMSR